MVRGQVEWAAGASIGAVAIVCAVVATGAAPPLDEAATEVAVAPARARPAAPRRHEPDRTFTLDAKLSEISGLATALDGKSLWAVHDEKPTLFRLSMEDGSILEEIDLGKRGDFEGVERVGDRVWVARSDGLFLVVDPSGQHELETVKLTKSLGAPCDVEGIAYDAKHERMLVSCKNESVRSKKSGKVFEIWAVDLKSREVEKKPAFEIDAKQLDAKGFKGKAFAASGLAVHPKTGELWVLSSGGKLLVVLSAGGELVRVEPLDEKVHRQPEGIAFGPDGTLFISDEARGEKARLSVYPQ